MSFFQVILALIKSSSEDPTTSIPIKSTIKHFSILFNKPVNLLPDHWQSELPNLIELVHEAFKRLTKLRGMNFPYCLYFLYICSIERK